MGRRPRWRSMGVGALAIAAIQCDSFGPSCTWESVAVEVLPANFPTCAEGLTPAVASDGGESENAATAQCQSLCARFGSNGPNGSYTCCVSTWEPDTVECAEVCKD